MPALLTSSWNALTYGLHLPASAATVSAAVALVL